jgi:hypothetical protein
VTKTVTQFEYQKAADAILKSLKGERDRQIVARRFGLGLPKRHTLEKIGSQYGITRERVRQIEKAAMAKLQQSPSPEIQSINDLLVGHLEEAGHVTPQRYTVEQFGATETGNQAYIVFLASLAPQVEVIEESDHFEPGFALLPHYDKQKIANVADRLIQVIKQHGKPLPIDALTAKSTIDADPLTIHNIAQLSKKLANLDKHWGLTQWPTVNPRSIRDKTYLVLRQHGKPLHFSEIASRITNLGAKKRTVTVQAVHNELIKDGRFVLVGRGIYALSDWGYTPGTVADIITEVLRQESPLHKDEIVKRVLKRRQVKTTTIILNLQEKNQFVRVAKATYGLK